MTTRRYISPIIFDRSLWRPAWRAAIASQRPKRLISEIPTDDDGAPIHTTCVCEVLADEATHARIAAMPDVEVMP